LIAAAPTEPLKSAKTKTAGASDVDFEDDPLIKKALELFKGQIVNVHS
jgi:hypothetical protein